MKWYFAAGGRDKINVLLEEKVKSILVSYAYAKKGLPDELLKAVRNGTNLMIDSGAYSNVFKPGTVTLEGYCEFLKTYKDQVTEYITMDDPKKREITLRNLAFMHKQGLKPIVVDHVWFELEPSFKKLYANGSKMCWGGMVSGPGSPMGHWAKGLMEKRKAPPSFFQDPKVWRAVMLRIKGRHDHACKKPCTQIHLLAVGQRLRRLAPFLDVVDSFDSSTWSLASGYGRLMLAVEGVDGAPPRLRQIPPDNPPKEFLDRASLYKLDFKHWDGRRRMAVREQTRYYKMLEEWHAENKGKGFDHLLEMSVKKSHPSEDAFASRELLVQVPAHFDEGALSAVTAQRETEVCYGQVQKVELDFGGDEVYIDTGDGVVRLTCVPVKSREVVKSDRLTKQVPDQSSPDEDKRAAQEERSKEFGIEALEGKGERLSFPAGFPKDLKLYGDPVNLMYPLDPPGRARNARARFKQFAKAGYEKDSSRAVVHTRIVRRLLEIGAKPSFDPNDKLDKLLASDVKAKLQEQEKAAITKAEQQDITLLPVQKADEDRNIVFGVVLEPDSVDAQGDTIDSEEIERASHLWLARFQDRGLQHEKIVNSKVEIYESYIAPTDLTVGGQKVKKGTWLLMLHVLDKDLWGRIKSGAYTGFSMGGFARRVRT